MTWFYSASRRHHAYAMAIDFGMKFEKQNGFWTPEGLLHISGAGGYKIVVAKESLHLLEPQIGDLLELRCGGAALLLTTLSENARSGFGRIIQRDGLPFNWPERDEISETIADA